MKKVRDDLASSVSGDIPSRCHPLSSLTWTDERHPYCFSVKPVAETETKRKLNRK